MKEPSALATRGMSSVQTDVADVVSSNVARAWGAREIEMTPLLEQLRRRPLPEADEDAGVPGFFVIFVLAVCQALSEVPLLNSRWTAEGIVVTRGVDIGLDVATGRGRIAPVVRRADTLSAGDLAAALVTAARRARRGMTRPDECAGGSFTAGYAGAYGSVLSRPLLLGGQAGIYHVGAVRRVVGVVADGIAVREVCYASLAFDHRIIDGSTSAQFQNLVKSKVESWRLAE